MCTDIVTSLLNNSASWIVITDEIIDKLQDFRNRFMLRFFEGYHNRDCGIRLEYVTNEK